MAAAFTISSGAIKKLLDTIPALGVDATAVCVEAGFPPDVAQDPDARVPLATLHLLWEAVLARLPRPDLALQVAAQYAPGDYGLVGFLCLNSATLREALEHIVRYSRLWTDAPGMVLTPDGSLELLPREPLPARAGYRLAQEAALAEILHGARVVSGDATLHPQRVEFAHRAPKDVAHHVAWFGCPVVFDAARTALCLGPDAMTLTLPNHNAQLGAFLRTLANEALAKRGDPGGLLERVRNLLAQEMPKGVPDVGVVARQLSMGERTLRRRLEEEGTSFRDLLDDTRAELARGYVKDRRLPLSEVAFMLGFSEQSAFHRAFKRWTTMTPAAWRARG
jgi:AraC-like DNA-binding protein